MNTYEQPPEKIQRDINEQAIKKETEFFESTDKTPANAIAQMRLEIRRLHRQIATREYFHNKEMNKI